MPLRILIADDEPIARRGIRSLLKNETDIEIVSECGDGLETVQAIGELNPDLVFLDIHMPELDGFGVVDALKDGPIPFIIFVTAHDEFALQAFRVHALDYLLKPVKPDLFREALTHARTVIASGQDHTFEDKVRNILNVLAPSQKPLERIAVRSSRNIIFVDVREIDWIEAYGDYVKLHQGQKKHILRQKIGDLEQRLDPGLFLRIHRSSIVQINRIKEMIPETNGDYTVFLADGTRLMLSRSYRAHAFEALRMNP